MIKVGKILKAVKPGVCFFKVEGDDLEELKRWREEVVNTINYINK